MNNPRRVLVFLVVLASVLNGVGQLDEYFRTRAGGITPDHIEYFEPGYRVAHGLSWGTTTRKFGHGSEVWIPRHRGPLLSIISVPFALFRHWDPSVLWLISFFCWVGACVVVGEMARSLYGVWGLPVFAFAASTFSYGLNGISEAVYGFLLLLFVHHFIKGSFGVSSVALGLLALTRIQYGVICLPLLLLKCRDSRVIFPLVCILGAGVYGVGNPNWEMQFTQDADTGATVYEYGRTYDFTFWEKARNTLKTFMEMLAFGPYLNLLCLTPLLFFVRWNSKLGLLTAYIIFSTAVVYAPFLFIIRYSAVSTWLIYPWAARVYGVYLND